MSNFNKSNKHCYFCKDSRSCLNLSQAVKCSGCDALYHPSCAEKAPVLPSGAFAKCCNNPKITPTNIQSKAKTSQQNIDANTQELTSKSEDISLSDLLGHIKNNNLILQQQQLNLQDIINKINDTEVKLISSIDSNSSEIKTINLNVSNLNIKIDKFKVKLDKVFSTVQDLKNEYSKLKLDLESLESLVQANKSNIEHLNSLEINVDHSNSKSSEIVELAVQEILERNKRSLNLIAYNVVEQDDNKADTDVIRKIFLNTPIKSSSIKTSRIGKRKSNGCRPVIITFENKQDAFYVLQNRSILSDSIKFTKDKTVMERDKLRCTIQELENRKKNGESNLSVKYLNGVPTIVVNKHNIPKN